MKVNETLEERCVGEGGQDRAVCYRGTVEHATGSGDWELFAHVAETSVRAVGYGVDERNRSHSFLGSLHSRRAIKTRLRFLSLFSSCPPVPSLPAVPDAVHRAQRPSSTHEIAAIIETLA